MTGLRTSYACLATVALLAGCGPKVTLPPVSPDDVEVITEKPNEDFEEISDIRQEAAMDTPRRELVDRAREKAARLGADALLIKEYRLNQSTQNPTVTLLAVAIYFPSRHPELRRSSGSG